MSASILDMFPFWEASLMLFLALLLGIFYGILILSLRFRMITTDEERMHPLRKIWIFIYELEEKLRIWAFER